MRLALIIEYEGTNYHGYQYQTNAPSIQEALERAIVSFTGERVRTRGAGRTDAGVHAEGQVVAFDSGSSHSPTAFVRALNFHLPNDIAVRTAQCVGEAFDPRRDALSRTYRYTILNRPTPSPLRRTTACLVTQPLNIQAMRRAAKLLVGTHDFARFCGTLEAGKNGTTRHIFAAAVRSSGEIVTFEVKANAFLPHQVRRMAGSLVDIGRGNLSLEEFNLMIDGGRSEAGARSLGPEGLCLINVTYADFPRKNGESDGNQH